MRSIFPIIFMALAIAIAVIFIGPMYSEISDLRQTVDAYQTALTHSTELQKTRDELLESYNAIPRDDKEKLTKFMPNTVDNIQLILEIQQIASYHGMALKNIAFEPPKTETEQALAAEQAANDPNAQKPYGVFNLQFKTESTYETFEIFLRDIEQNLRLIDIESIAFEVPKDTKPSIGVDPNVYTFDIKVRTYWLKH